MKYNVAYKDFVFQRKFGIELELSNNLSKKKIKQIIIQNSPRKVKVSRYVNTYNNSNWHVKTDGSCGPRGDLGPSGVEIASFVCSTQNDLNHVLDIAKQIKDHGGLVNDFCGLHIHIDASDLDLTSVGKILVHWLAIEPILMFALPAKRWGNKFCQNLHPCNFPRLIDYQYTYYGYKGMANLYRPLQLDINARRKTLNLCNFFNALRLKTDIRKTLELRWPEGTLEIEDIKGWVMFFLSFIECTRTNNFKYFS